MPHQPFFGGDNVRSNIVGSLNVNTFKGLVEGFIHSPEVISMTRAEYVRADKDTQKVKKCVRYFCPSTFAPDEQGICHRLKAGAQAIRLVFLDIDSSKDAKNVLSTLSNIDYNLDSFNYTIYHTATSTKELPRIRLILEADGFSPELYSKAVEYVADLMGVTPNSESKNCVQPMFMPSVFEGDKEEHPLVVVHSDRQPITPRDFEGFEPGEDSYAYTPQSKETSGGTSGQELMYLRMPSESITLEDVKEALTHISPDCKRLPWLLVAASMKHQFGADEEAFEVFDSWGQLSKEGKYSEEATLKAWGSFKRTPLNRLPITIRSLLHQATEVGWINTSVKQKCTKSVKAFIWACETLSCLVGEGIQRIVNMPMAEEADIAILTAELISCANKKHPGVYTKTELKKLVKRAKGRRETSIRISKKGGESIPDWLKGKYYVSTQNMVYDALTKVEMVKDAFNTQNGVHLLPSLDSIAAAPGPMSRAMVNKPEILPIDFMINEMKCPTVDRIFYDPAKPDDRIIHEDGVKCLNIYRPSFVKAANEQREIAGALVEEHLSNLIEEEEYQKVVLDFIAYLVQHPGKKIYWAVYLQGGQGCGKGLLKTLLCHILGQENVGSVSNDALESQFTEWMQGKQVQFFDELNNTGRERVKSANKIKPFVTEERVHVIKKGITGVDVRNLTNLFITTNIHNALHMESNSRRYFVLKSPLQTKEDIQAIGGEEYFNRMFKGFRQYAGGLRAYFESHQIRECFSPKGIAPETVYLKQLTDDTETDAAIFIKEAIGDDSHKLIREEIVSYSQIAEERSASGMHFSMTQVSAELQNMGYVKCSQRPRVEGKRHTIWVLKRSKEFNKDSDFTQVLNKWAEEEAPNNIFEDIDPMS